ncbi:hypothetical protein JYT51_02130, partial [Candidatus Amoebophilus asiaticus]|nr:hypothetical protein [Candidatus Amoebophilus asiaticus]
MKTTNANENLAIERKFKVLVTISTVLLFSIAVSFAQDYRTCTDIHVGMQPSSAITGINDKGSGVYTCYQKQTINGNTIELAGTEGYLWYRRNGGSWTKTKNIDNNGVADIEFVPTGNTGYFLMADGQFLGGNGYTHGTTNCWESTDGMQWDPLVTTSNSALSLSWVKKIIHKSINGNIYVFIVDDSKIYRSPGTRPLSFTLLADFRNASLWIEDLEILSNGKAIMTTENAAVFVINDVLTNQIINLYSTNLIQIQISTSSGNDRPFKVELSSSGNIYLFQKSGQRINCYRNVNDLQNNTWYSEITTPVFGFSNWDFKIMNEKLFLMGQIISYKNQISDTDQWLYKFGTHVDIRDIFYTGSHYLFCTDGGIFEFDQDSLLTNAFRTTDITQHNIAAMDIQAVAVPNKYQGNRKLLLSYTWHEGIQIWDLDSGIYNVIMRGEELGVTSISKEMTFSDGRFHYIGHVGGPMERPKKFSFAENCHINQIGTCYGCSICIDGLSNLDQIPIGFQSALDPNNVNRCYFFKDNTIYRYDNGTITQFTIPSLGNFVSILIDDQHLIGSGATQKSKNIYFCFQNGIYASSDGGDTWSTIYQFNQNTSCDKRIEVVALLYNSSTSQEPNLVFSSNQWELYRLDLNIQNACPIRINIQSATTSWGQSGNVYNTLKSISCDTGNQNIYITCINGVYTGDIESTNGSDSILLKKLENLPTYWRGRNVAIDYNHNKIYMASSGYGIWAISRTTIPITAHPENRTICEGDSVSFMVATSGAGVSSQWQISTDGGNTFNNLSNSVNYSGMNSNMLTIRGATLSQSNYKFRCIISDPNSNSVTSRAALLIVNPLPIVAVENRNITMYIHDTTQLYATSTGLNYQWSPGLGLSATNIYDPQAFPSSTTTYTVSSTDFNGCRASDQVSISVIPYNMKIRVTPDDYPTDITWTLKKWDNNSVQSVRLGDHNNLTITEVCSTIDTYEFIIDDYYGDGICCQWGQGSYFITNNGDTVDNYRPSLDDPYYTRYEVIKLDTGTQQIVSIDFTADGFPGDLAWQITDANGTVIYPLDGTFMNMPTSVPNAPFSYLTKLHNLLPAGCYTLIVTDSYGDGICCDHGQGSILIHENNNPSPILAYIPLSNEPFNTLTRSFCVTSNSLAAKSTNDHTLSPDSVFYAADSGLHIANIYPNPTNDRLVYLHIENNSEATKNVQVEVKNSIGTLVHTEHVIIDRHVATTIQMNLPKALSAGI